MTRFTVVLVSVFAGACVGQPPSGGDGDGNGNGDGTGGGDGTGNGSGTGSGSGTGTGTGTGTGGTMTASKFLEDISKKFCDGAFMCQATFPTDAGVTFAQAYGTSATACYADAAASNDAASVEASITAGKIQFSGADAAACIAGIAMGTCDAFWTEGPTMPAACDTAMVGTVADGGACANHIECQNLQAWCDETTNVCTPDESGARLITADAPWHTQTAAVLRDAQ